MQRSAEHDPPVDHSRTLLYRAGMDPGPDRHDLARQIVRLDGKVNTSRAENDAMESRIETRLAGMEADMAKRETRLIFAMTAIVALGFTIFGFVTA